MKILKITKTDFGIEVEIEGYPNDKPVFSEEITADELKTKLAEWKVAQDAVDLQNASRITPVITELKPELKDLEGKEV